MTGSAYRIAGVALVTCAFLQGCAALSTSNRGMPLAVLAGVVSQENQAPKAITAVQGRDGNGFRPASDSAHTIEGAVAIGSQSHISQEVCVFPGFCFRISVPTSAMHTTAPIMQHESAPIASQDRAGILAQVGDKPRTVRTTTSKRSFGVRNPQAAPILVGEQSEYLTSGPAGSGFHGPNRGSAAVSNLPNLGIESAKIDNLVRGNVAVSAPQTTVAGDSFSVFLRVSPQNLAVVMQALREEVPENPTVKGQQGVKLTPRMTASVSGIGFEILPKEGQTQAISTKEPTTWAWQAKAIESGTRTLNFTLSGALTVEGENVSRDFYSYRQKVDVEVRPMSFVEQHWQWLISTLLIPIGAWAWRVLLKFRTAKRKPRSRLTEAWRGGRRHKLN